MQVQKGTVVLGRTSKRKGLICIGPMPIAFLTFVAIDLRIWTSPHFVPVWPCIPLFLLCGQTERRTRALGAYRIQYLVRQDVHPHQRRRIEPQGACRREICGQVECMLSFCGRFGANQTCHRTVILHLGPRLVIWSLDSSRTRTPHCRLIRSF